MAIKIAGTEVINDNRELVLAKLTEINTSIADTAVDIFVYDTRKDSDGGAWRKRTQHTSWYNETLNTATRGSRKEFPAVAVIVVDSSANVTIYDADDPDLPMWMVFEWGSYSRNGLLDYTAAQATSALNGLLYIGTSGTSNSGIINESYTQGLALADFINDRGIFYKKGEGYGTNARNTWGQYLSKRNADLFPATSTDNTSGSFLGNFNIKDVAMTVLPNAPIDAATGLPVPTVAVANRNYSNYSGNIIKDDGTVKNINAFTGNTSHSYDFVSFSDVGTVWWGRDFLFNDGYAYVANTTVDGSLIAEYGSTFGGRSTSKAQLITNGSEISNIPKIKGLTQNGYAVGQTVGLNIFNHNSEDQDRSSVAHITSTYNTGWMNGDIKLSTLSDTDDTNVTGSELVTNGTFDTDTSGWTGGNGATLSVVSGALRVTNDGSTSYPFAQQTITTEVGKTYTMSARGLTSPSHNWYIEVVGLGGSGQQTTEYQSHTFKATGTATYIRVIHRGAANGDYKDFDDISVRLAEEDRSVNGNGLQVFGTVTKSAVATGADLVGYSGFSTSNYLSQPYNSDLDWGTGDFCIMAWAKWDGVDANQAIISRSSTDGQDDRIDLEYSGAANAWRLYTRASGTAITVSSTANAASGVWAHLVAIRRNGLIELFVNGISQGTATQSANLTDTHNSPTYIGTGVYGGNSFGGSLALIRTSATAPSAEQIKKIYEDEKVLFQEGAQATLYGESDAVTALAYDDDTNLLHVGTSAGRSVFQGLKRVDNTTTAVGAAISASNGLVADE